MRPIMVVAKWPDHVHTSGGDREDFALLLKRSCQGAVQVHVDEETAIIHDVRHVTAALEKWQANGGLLEQDAAWMRLRESAATRDVAKPPWAAWSELLSVVTALYCIVRYKIQRGGEV